MSIVKTGQRAELKQILSALRLAMLDNRTFLCVKKKKIRYSAIWQILFNCGFIEGFEERGDIVIIRIKQVYWKNFKFPVHPFLDIEPTKTHSSVISVKKMTKQQKHNFGSEIVLNTDKGVLLARQAISKKVGGIPLFKIY